MLLQNAIYRFFIIQIFIIQIQFFIILLLICMGLENPGSSVHSVAMMSLIGLESGTVLKFFLIFLDLDNFDQYRRVIL